MLKVMKFGGGCLKTAKDFFRVVNIIASEKEPPLVVVSAINGITDHLISALFRARLGERQAAGILDILRESHWTIVEKTVRHRENLADLEKRIAVMLSKIEELLQGVSISKEITPVLYSRVLSYGERLAATVLAGVLRDQGREAQALESEQIGLITDRVLENAAVDLKRFQKNFQKILPGLQRSKKIGVITGFFGCTPQGTISTFGRNGSDYSAAAVAFAARASELEIWKDTDGFMSADPKLIKTARPIDRLSYHEAADLSFFGATILHPRTIEPLEKLKISFHIKNFNSPEKKGTAILPDGYERPGILKSVTANRQIARLRIHKTAIGSQPLLSAEIGRQLASLGVTVYSIFSSPAAIYLLVDQKHASAGARLIKKILMPAIETIAVEKNLALIAVVGHGLQKQKALVSRICSALSARNIHIELMAAEASPTAACFIVKKADSQKVIQTIHQEFFC